MAFLASVIGRMLLALIFIISGVTKVMNVSQTQAFIDKVTTLPANLALPVGIFELVFGVFLAIGFLTRISSLLLFGFTLATVFFFHNQLGDQLQLQLALKNLAIAGGLLMVFAYGQPGGAGRGAGKGCPRGRGTKCQRPRGRPGGMKGGGPA